MQIVKIGQEYRVFSWTQGYVSTPKRDLSVDAEAARGEKCAEAVINRLLLMGREKEAERILEEYV